MKKDIDLLAGLNESSNKGNSSSMMIVIFVLILALVGGMVFMFVSAKNDLKETEQNIASLQNKINMQSDPEALKGDLAKLKEKYDMYSVAAIRKIYSGFTIDQQSKINNKLYEILYTNYLNKVCVLDNGQLKYEPVRINSIDATEEGAITMVCYSNTDEEAWFFINYLNGVLAWTNYDGSPMIAPTMPTKPTKPAITAVEPKPLPEGATEEQIAEYNKKVEAYNAALEVDEKNEEQYKKDMMTYYQDAGMYNIYNLCVAEDAKLYDEEGNAIEGATNNILSNKGYLSEVEYPGLPAPSDEKQYSITFQVTLKINWRAVV